MSDSESDPGTELVPEAETKVVPLGAPAYCPVSLQAPPMDPRLGAKTPEYMAWYKKMDPAGYEQRYNLKVREAHERWETCGDYDKETMSVATVQKKAFQEGLVKGRAIQAVEGSEAFVDEFHKKIDDAAGRSIADNRILELEGATKPGRVKRFLRRMFGKKDAAPVSLVDADGVPHPKRALNPIAQALFDDLKKDSFDYNLAEANERKGGITSFLKSIADPLE